MTSTTTSTEDRAISLLGQGVAPEMVASAVGVTASRISQLISDPEISAKVAELRFKNLSAHNERDLKYDKMEDMLLEKLADMIPFMIKPFEVLKAIAIINGAKRRGASAPETIQGQRTVIPLIMPVQIIQNFSAERALELNSNNQVIRAGNQDLVTVQSGSMAGLLAKSKSTLLENSPGAQNVQTASLIPSP